MATKTKKKGARASGRIGARKRAIRDRLPDELLRMIGAELRERRKAKNLSQDEVGRAMGRSGAHVWNIESGNKDPWKDLPTIEWQAMKSVLGIDEEDLAKALGFENSEVFYGHKQAQEDRPKVKVKYVSGESGVLAIGAPEIEDYPESKLFLHEAPGGIKIIMTPVKNPKRDLLPGDMVLVEEEGGERNVCRFSGWTNTRPSRMVFIKGSDRFELPGESVVGKAVLVIGPPEMRI